MPALAGIQYHSIRLLPRAAPNLARDDSFCRFDLRLRGENAKVRLGMDMGLWSEVRRSTVAAIIAMRLLWHWCHSPFRYRSRTGRKYPKLKQSDALEDPEHENNSILVDPFLRLAQDKKRTLVPRRILELSRPCRRPL